MFSGGSSSVFNRAFAAASVNKAASPIHAPVQKRTHHAEVRIDGRIVELLVLHIEDIILHRFLCDGMDGLFRTPKNRKKLLPFAA